MKDSKFTCNGTTLPIDALVCRINENYRKQASNDLPEDANDVMIAMRSVAQAIEQALKANSKVHLLKVGKNYALNINQPSANFTESLPSVVSQWIEKVAHGESPDPINFTLSLPYSIVENARGHSELLTR